MQIALARYGAMSTLPDDHVLEQNELVLLRLLDDLLPLQQEELRLPLFLLQMLIPFNYILFVLHFAVQFCAEVVHPIFVFDVEVHLGHVSVDEITSAEHVVVLDLFQIVQVGDHFGVLLFIFDDIFDFRLHFTHVVGVLDFKHLSDFFC